MKFKIIMEIDTVLYEREYGIKITDPNTFLKSITQNLIPPGTKSVTVRIEK